MKRALCWALAMGLLYLFAFSGCLTRLQVANLEAAPVVKHYEKMRNQLKKKEQSGAEGGCPTCVY